MDRFFLQRRFISNDKTVRSILDTLILTKGRITHSRETRLWSSEDGSVTDSPVTCDASSLIPGLVCGSVAMGFQLIQSGTDGIAALLAVVPQILHSDGPFWHLAEQVGHDALCFEGERRYVQRILWHP